MIEGGLERRPDNVLIYVTSNRRHLIREKFSDKEDRRDQLHAGDVAQFVECVPNMRWVWSLALHKTKSGDEFP